MKTNKNKVNISTSDIFNTSLSFEKSDGLKNDFYILEFENYLNKTIKQTNEKKKN